jgi:hypothetical protein
MAGASPRKSVIPCRDDFLGTGAAIELHAMAVADAADAPSSLEFIRLCNGLAAHRAWLWHWKAHGITPWRSCQYISGMVLKRMEPIASAFMRSARW